MDQDEEYQGRRVVTVHAARAEEEDLPTELYTINCSSGFAAVSTDKLSVKYARIGLQEHDVGVVQANRPAPVKRLVYYFEMFVRNAGSGGEISIGFTGENFKMWRHPGWEAKSCGYHGDDGNLYLEGKVVDVGQKFTTNDTVGCGINYASQEIFFTKNGTIVRTLYKDIEGPLFPTVAVHSQNEEVEVNFGQRPFTFDLKSARLVQVVEHLPTLPYRRSSRSTSSLNNQKKNPEYEAQERMRQQMTIEKISLRPFVSHAIVRTYLLHCGYEETLDAFDSANKSTITPISVPQEYGVYDAYALHQRKVICQLIRNGEIDAAFNRIQEWHPVILQGENLRFCFLLYRQKFIELVRVGDLEEAVRYGRNELSKFFGQNIVMDALLQECATLLAYEHPQESSVGYLLMESIRELVADGINSIILSTNQNCPLFCFSALGAEVRQLSVCSLEGRSLNGDEGEAFHLRRFLNSGS